MKKDFVTVVYDRKKEVTKTGRGKNVTGQTPSEFFAVQSGRAERLDEQRRK